MRRASCDGRAVLNARAPILEEAHTRPQAAIRKGESMNDILEEAYLVATKICGRRSSYRNGLQPATDA